MNLHAFERAEAGLHRLRAPDHRDDEVIGGDGQSVGTIGSLLVLPQVTAGLAVLRRETTVGNMVTAAGHEATVVALPFDATSLHD